MPQGLCTFCSLCTEHPSQIATWLLPQLLHVLTQMHLLMEAFPGHPKIATLTISNPVAHHFFPALLLSMALITL